MKHTEREMFCIEEAASTAVLTARRISNIVGTDEAYRKLLEAARLLDSQADDIRETLRTEEPFIIEENER